MWNIKSSEYSPLKVTYAPAYMHLLVIMHYHTGPCVADPPASRMMTGRTCSETMPSSLVISISREPTPSDTVYKDWTNLSMIAVYIKKKAGSNAT